VLCLDDPIECNGSVFRLSPIARSCRSFVRRPKSAACSGIHAGGSARQPTKSASPLQSNEATNDSNEPSARYLKSRLAVEGNPLVKPRALKRFVQRARELAGLQADLSEPRWMCLREARDLPWPVPASERIVREFRSRDRPRGYPDAMCAGHPAASDLAPPAAFQSAHWIRHPYLNSLNRLENPRKRKVSRQFLP
jgi:hypothetical protein